MKIFFTALLLITLLFAIYLMNPRVWAAEPQTKELMGNLLSHMTALKPYVVSEEKFGDKKNSVEIDGHLKELSRLVKAAGHDPRLQLTGYRISRKVLEDHIKETERVFRIGNKQYARWMLSSTYSICMSCHTQIPTASRVTKDFETLDPMFSSFDQAEFFFATRAFDQSRDLYEKIVVDYPENKATSEQVETALQRVITYYARIKRNPQAAVETLERYQKNTKLPEFLKEDITAWVKSFKEWQKTPAPTFKSGEQVVEFAKKSLDPKVSGYVMTADNPRAATYLKVSGILYEYLQQNPNSPSTPDLLYWLAICDKGLNNNFFFSLGDIYLRECIVRFPYSKAAKDCYNEYEQSTIVSYSGSGGTNVPDEVKHDLSQLKALTTAPAPNGARH